MNFDEGHSPEEILESIKLEDAQLNKGLLKIFLGMAAGVGKTYAMLDEAQVLRKEQVDIALGNIEAHGRTEIEALLKNLPRIPPKIIHYKDKEFKELDVDAIINLNPGIILIDELAHNNTPGSKNEKRWQDVQEILDHGISVHTTLNVQHIDSLSDIILDITEIAVKETVPDVIIGKAHSIQLIDLTPDELLQRLEEGKVYTDEQSKTASLHFFQKNKLAALREIALRYVAEKIDKDLMCMVTTKEGRIEWKTREKFLVAINDHPRSQKLIKATRRLATQANAPWFAVYVDTGKTLIKENEKQLEKLTTLTRVLGAEVIIIHDPDVAEGIKRVAYQRDITQIILGRARKNFMFSLFQGPTLMDKLAGECKNIDIHIIRQERYIASNRKTLPSDSSPSKISDYLYISLSVLLIASFSQLTLSLIGYGVAEFLFFISISGLSFFFKRGPVIFSGILFGLIWGFFFIPSLTESPFSATNEIILLILYVLTAMSFGIFVERTRNQREWLRKNNEKNSQLKEILTCLESNLELQEALVSIEEHLPKILDGIYKFVIKNNKGTLDMDTAFALVGNEERMTAFWAFENGNEAGWSTETFPLSENLYIPLKGSKQIMGILIYRPIDRRLLTKDERNLIDHVCQILSNHLENSSGIEKKHSI